MRRPLARARALFAVPLLLAAAACQDESPTLGGDDLFPGGVRPTTLEVIVPAAEFLEVLGVYTGFADARDFGFQQVANQFGGVLDAHTLIRPTFPRDVSFSQDGVTRSDSLYVVRSARLTLLADSAGSAPGDAAVRVYELAQGFDFGTVTWTVATDTAAAPVPWTEPGGTRGALLGSGSYIPGTAGDSINVALDSVAAGRLRASSARGAVVTLAQPGTRVQVGDASLTVRVRPTNAVRDTTLEITVPLARTFIYTPDPPRTPGALEAGGVRAARSIFSVDLDRTVPGCPAPQSCQPLHLRDVQLNRVSLLLDPRPSPAGFQPFGTVPLTLWTVPEPELGARAPLQTLVNDAFPSTGPVVTYEAGADPVEVPFTAYALGAVRSDSLPTTFALLGEAPPASVGAPERNFGVSVFEAAPRLRIVYTLPNRPSLP